MPVVREERQSWKAQPRPKEQPRKYRLDDAIYENSYPNKQSDLRPLEYQKIRFQAKNAPRKRFYIIPLVPVF